MNRFLTHWHFDYFVVVRNITGIDGLLKVQTVTIDLKLKIKYILNLKILNLGKQSSARSNKVGVQITDTFAKNSDHQKTNNT